VYHPRRAQEELGASISADPFWNQATV
jgi:hypothetical protein